MGTMNRHYKGLTFKYFVDEIMYHRGYKTIDKFINYDFSIDHPLSPKLDTNIVNIRWDNRLVRFDSSIDTVLDLLEYIKDVNQIEVYPKKIKQRYYRKTILTIKEVEDSLKDIVLNNTTCRENMIENKKLKVVIDGEEIKALSDRYKLFFTKGYTCVSCGVTGTYFALERNAVGNDRYHLNLYGTNDIGEEVLMTKDHIIPKSKGGKNSIDNYQTMCCKCNREKGNKL